MNSLSHDTCVEIISDLANNGWKLVNTFQDEWKMVTVNQNGTLSNYHLEPGSSDPKYSQRHIAFRQIPDSAVITQEGKWTFQGPGGEPNVVVQYVEEGQDSGVWRGFNTSQTQYVACNFLIVGGPYNSQHMTMLLAPSETRNIWPSNQYDRNVVELEAAVYEPDTLR